MTRQLLPGQESSCVNRSSPRRHSTSFTSAGSGMCTKRLPLSWRSFCKKKANRSERDRSERDFTNTYISWADSDFSLRSRNDSAPRELGRLRRKREEADSEGRLRSTGFVFAAADPAGSAHPEGRSQSRCRFDQYKCGRWQLRSDVPPDKLRIYGSTVSG
jgi:hypothetical protein